MDENPATKNEYYKLENCRSQTEYKTPKISIEEQEKRQWI